jgi:pimeloyl-ACP methyl ester carboxylesterase
MSAATDRVDNRWRSISLARPWGRLRVWQAGSGPPLLLLHGLGGSGRYWRAIAHAVEHDYHVIAPDLAGFGGSTKDAARYDRHAHLDDLDAVVAELAPDGRLVVAGHSLGGLLGALWAERARARLTALALVAAPYPAPRAVGGPQAASRPLPQRGLRHAARHVSGAAARIAVPVVAFPFGLARGYPLGLVVDFARQDAASRRGTLRSLLVDPAVTGELAGLRGLDDELSVLLLAARDDRLVPPAALERWSALFPRAEAHLPGAGGHQLLWRGGDALLVRWLQETAQRNVSPEVIGQADRQA